MQQFDPNQPDLQGPGINGEATDDPAAFKKGAVPTWVFIVAAVAVLGLGSLLFIGYKQEQATMTDFAANAEMKKLFKLSEAKQKEEWRKWAKTTVNDRIRREALKQLAYMKDPEGVKLAIEALDSMDQPTQARAAVVLAHYGSPMADAAKPKLLEKLEGAPQGSKPQIAWTLVELGESKAWKEVFELYKEGKLADVRRLDRGRAFDHEKLAALISLDELAKLADSKEVHVREMVAMVLSKAADKRFTSTLVKLLNDEEPRVGVLAAPGLGKIGGEEATKPLVKKLKKANKQARTDFLAALKNGLGGRGLVMALEAVDTGKELTDFGRREKILKMIRELADPTGADALAAYMKQEEHPYHKTMAAFALAEIGDLRAVPVLAKRLRQDASKIYSDEKPWEQQLKKSNRERYQAASLLADLAKMRPDKHQQIREESEDALVFYSHFRDFPQDEAWRALSGMKSEADLKSMLDWAKPTAPLPKEGAGAATRIDFKWEYGGTALRYLGALKEKKAWSLLTDALKKKPADVDLSRKSLDEGGLTKMYEALNGYQTGAAMGFSEWGDPKAFKLLTEFVDDPKQLEDPRVQSCNALAYVAEDKDLIEVAKKILKFKGKEAEDGFRRDCYLKTLTRRPIPAAAPSMLRLMKKSESLAARHQAARALGKGGFDDTIKGELMELLKDKKLFNDAALALLLGADPATAGQVIATYADRRRTDLDELQLLWAQSFYFITEEDLKTGRLGKWLDNARAIARVSLPQNLGGDQRQFGADKKKPEKEEAVEGEAVGMIPQKWAEAQIIQTFKDMEYDNGPHSLTRPVLRFELFKDAKSDDPKRRERAVRAFLFMKAEGALYALSQAKGDVAKLAKDAYHRLMNPADYSGAKTIKREKGEPAP